MGHEKQKLFHFEKYCSQSNFLTHDKQWQRAFRCVSTQYNTLTIWLLGLISTQKTLHFSDVPAF
jgi:hypothetical protein